MTENVKPTVADADSTVAVRAPAKVGCILLGISLFPFILLYAAKTVGFALPEFLARLSYFMMYFVSFVSGLTGVLFLFVALIVFIIAKFRQPVGEMQDD